MLPTLLLVPLSSSDCSSLCLCPTSSRFFLQSLCIKLGTVTGMDLAQNCKAHLPPWLNYLLYFFAESAIIATDIAEVRLVSKSDILKLT